MIEVKTLSEASAGGGGCDGELEMKGDALLDLLAVVRSNDPCEPDLCCRAGRRLGRPIVFIIPLGERVSTLAIGVARRPLRKRE